MVFRHSNSVSFGSVGNNGSICDWVDHGLNEQFIGGLMNKNEKNFRLVNTISKNFQIIIANFQYAATLLFNINMKIPIGFVPSFISKLVTAMRLRRIRIVISTVKLIANMTQAISSRRVNLAFVIRERLKAVTSIVIKHPILFVSKARQKLVSIVNEGFLHIGWVMTLATFFTLGDFDLDTLGTLDVLTLGDMDYTV